MKIFFIGLISTSALTAAILHYALKGDWRHPKSTAERANIASLILNVWLFTLTIFSLYIAIDTYRGAKQSGEEQLGALNASRDALDKVVKIVQTQTALLQQDHDLVQMEAKRSNKDRARKPDIQIRLGGVPWDVVKQAIRGTKTLTITRAVASSLSVNLENVGDKALEKPLIRMSATPDTISVQRPLQCMPSATNTIDCFSPSIPDILPASNVKLPSGFLYAMTIPESVTEIKLYILVGGLNMDKREFIIPMNVIP